MPGAAGGEPAGSRRTRAESLVEGQRAAVRLENALEMISFLTQFKTQV